MKSVVLAEKPSVARDIARVLKCTNKKDGYMENNQYIVTWALGHLVTNADPEQYDSKYKTWDMAQLPIIPERMKTVVIGKTRKQFNVVKRLIERDDVKEVIIATDAGREGELVARLILEKCKGNKPIKRLWISSVTDKAILDGFKHLKNGNQYQGLYMAALARSEADWIVGINATRALTTKYAAQLSTGRVQTPTLQMVKLRQDEINQFKAKDYYDAVITINGVKFKYMHQNRIFDEQVIDALIADVKGTKATVSELVSKDKKKFPEKLYDLTSLQQEAYKRFKYSAKETLNTMQSLYETHKLVTYPRTDSNYLTDDMVSGLKERVAALSGTEYKTFVVQLMKQLIKGNKHFVDNSKVSDHHAIVPTETKVRLDVLGAREKNIYMLIAERFLSVLMPVYQYKEERVILNVGKHQFQTTYEMPVEVGFKALFGEVSNKALHFKKGETYTFDIKKETKQTTPPPYFNEGTLLKAMENPSAVFKMDKSDSNVLKETGGIGTVATRADIIEKLYNLNAIENVSGNIKVTNKGKQLLELAPERLKSPELTAEWELKLNQIERGKYNKRAFIDEMQKFTREIIEEIKASDDRYKHDNLTSTKCPTCGKFMLEKKNRNGKMLVCSDPSCNTKKNVQRKTNARCPECKKKLTLHGKGPKAMYSCTCGFRETQEQMDKRFISKKTGKVSKNEMKKYMQKEEPINNPFVDMLKGLDL